MPGVTGNAYFMFAGLPNVSQRSSSKMASGVSAGTEAWERSTSKEVSAVKLLSPELTNSLGATSVSASQSGSTTGPPELTRCTTNGAACATGTTAPSAITATTSVRDSRLPRHRGPIPFRRPKGRRW